MTSRMNALTVKRTPESRDTDRSDGNGSNSKTDDLSGQNATRSIRRDGGGTATTCGGISGATQTSSFVLDREHETNPLRGRSECARRSARDLHDPVHVDGDHAGDLRNRNFLWDARRVVADFPVPAGKYFCVESAECLLRKNLNRSQFGRQLACCELAYFRSMDRRRMNAPDIMRYEGEGFAISRCHV